MTSQFQPGAVLNTQAFGVRPENIEVPHIDVRAPSSSDTRFPVGKWWLWPANGLWYLLNQTSSSTGLSSNWQQVLGGSTGISAVNGTANQITASTTTGVVTLSIPTTFIAPGSIASTTTITAGTGLTVTSGGAAITGTTTINTTGAATTTIGTGGTGVVAIGNAIGNTSVTGSLSASTTLTAGTGLTVTSGGATITAGGLTMNGGDIHQNAGNLIFANSNDGFIFPVPSSSGTSPQTVSGRYGRATFTGVSIAAAATQSFVINNGFFNSDAIWTMQGATTGSALSIQSITYSGGNATVVVTNGTGATTSVANITFTFLCLD